MNKVAALVVVGLSVVVVACSGNDDESSGSTAAALSVVDACSATVRCTIESDTKSIPLSKDAAGCHLGPFTLVAGGNAVVDDLDNVTWTSTTSTLSVCQGGDCVECVDPNAKAPAPSAAPGKCTGSSWSCSGRVAGTCSSQDGCSFTQHSHIKWNGDMELESECEGSSRACDEYDSKTSCEGQQGCSWK